MMVEAIPVAIGLKPLPDRFVVVGTDVFVKQPTLRCLSHEFFRSFEIAFHYQLAV